TWPAWQRPGRGGGLRRSALHDLVRDVRRPADPPTLSSGCAAELAQLMSDLSREFWQGAAAAGRVRGRLGKGMDLSQVGSGWGLDPLAHSGADFGLQGMNKTGTDAGIRAEVGVLTGAAADVVYAVLANWDEVDLPER
ncbi:MAG: class A beta-lactamase-related serine hydrolase, partial [Actinomycetota bacterium]|nr:class A beta-lactamase-related serine hydrolase [Actinomycetota bacterium]